jgi:hypothetical protein
LAFPDRVTGITPVGDTGDQRHEFAALVALLVDPAKNPLVAGTRRVSDLPAHAMRCSGGNVANHSGQVVPAVSGVTPVAALQDFLLPAGGQQPPIVAGLGYLELVDHAGNQAFAMPFSGGPGYVSVIWLTHTAGTWTVSRWETSGC